MNQILKKIYFSVFIFITAIVVTEIVCYINLKTFNVRFDKKSSSPPVIHSSKNLNATEKLISSLEIPSDLKSHFNDKSKHKQFVSFTLKEILDENQDMLGYKKSTVQLFFNDTKDFFTSFYKIVDFNYKRYVSHQEKKKIKNCFILAVGDSFTYGYGVTQGNEYPSQLAKIGRHQCFIYNLGVNGESVNDFYTRLSLNPNYLSMVQESSGDFFWLYINAQLQRMVLPTNVYTTNKFFQDKSEFSLDGNEIFYHGAFSERNRWQRKLIYFLSFSSIVRTFNLEIPKIHNEKNYELFLKLLDYGLEIFQQNQKVVNRKYIILYDKPQDLDTFNKLAIKYGFKTLPFYKILNTKNLQKNNGTRLSIPYDWHPTSEAYYLLANYIDLNVYRSSENK